MLDQVSNRANREKCASCGSKELKSYSNQVICLKCGYVLTSNNPSKVKEQVKLEKEKNQNPKDTIHLHRYSQNDVIEKWLKSAEMSNSTEKNLAQGFAEITKIGLTLNLPISILKEASDQYQILAKKRSFKGHSIKSLATATVYYTCKYNHYLTNLKEVSNKANVEVKETSKAYKFIKKTLTPKKTVIKPIHYLYKFNKHLDLSDGCKELTKEILKTIDKLKLTSGKNPLGIVAATIYISSKIIGEKITQRKLSEISRITQTTIRKRYKEILHSLNIEK